MNFIINTAIKRVDYTVSYRGKALACIDYSQPVKS